jgi:hypothetical protein
LVGWKDKSNDVYALIRSIHEDMGMNAAEFGDWQDVLVLHQAQQGTKRDDGRGQVDAYRTNPADFARNMAGRLL